MDQLWSPWRLEYVRDPKKRNEKECLFCRLARAELNPESLVLYRDADVFVVLNKFPYNNGHLMVVPTSHHAQLYALSPKVLHKMASWATACTTVLEKEINAQGFNVGFNLGDAAGAGIGAHLHQHIVPRWSGDTNFMPVLAEVKCIPDHLTSTYERLREPMIQALDNV